MLRAMRSVALVAVVVGSGCHPRAPAEPRSDLAPPRRAEPAATAAPTPSPPAATDNRAPEQAEANRERTGGMLGTLGEQMTGGSGYERRGFGLGGGAPGRGRIHTPKARAGQPVAVGGLAPALIRRQIVRDLAKFTYCYEKGLLARPELSGTVTAHFFIAPSGLVARADATGVDAVIASCVVTMIKRIEFPKPRGGGVQVTLPFSFALEPTPAP